ncbi:MAG: hypothetical protein ABIA59_03345 [Candidatus Latescibacterota bacterium]
MINEGLIGGGTAARIKSLMIQQIKQIGPTTPDNWERRVFRALTGSAREDVDWSFKDNQAGYYTWLRSFDQLIEELVEDGFVTVEELSGGGERTLVPSNHLIAG